jgi:hypothetical protein
MEQQQIYAICFLITILGIAILNTQYRVRKLEEK